MITIKVKSEQLVDNSLDYIVAKLENHQWRNHWMLEDQGFHSWNSYEISFGNPTPKYSSDWNKAGTIIDREKIDIEHTNWIPACTFAKYLNDDMGTSRQSGENSTIAAMRCYVAYKLGEFVDVPIDIYNNSQYNS